MIRTRFREGQVIDEDFLSEEEGSQRFIFKDGYGDNNTNLIIQDGYIQFDNIAEPNTPPADSVIIYPSQDDIYMKDSNGLVQQVGASIDNSFVPEIKVGATVITPDVAVGEYTKIGRSVTLAIYVSFTNPGGAFPLTVSIPFVGINTTNLIQSLNVGGLGLGGEVVSSTYGLAQYGVTLYGDEGASVLEPLEISISPTSSTCNLRRLGIEEELDASSFGETLSFNVNGTYLTD